MTIRETFKQLRDDIKTWATTNFQYLNGRLETVETIVNAPPVITVSSNNACLNMSLTSMQPDPPEFVTECTNSALTISIG